LFIDDEPEFVRPQVTALEDAGYTVTLETDPDEAIALLQEQEFDLIILDLIMPPRRKNRKRGELELDFAETGVKLHQEIRDGLGLADVPIIFLTVVRDQDIRREIRRREREYEHRLRFLTKPARSSDVVAEVRRTLGDTQSVELL
ncbi:MAG TPA: response regulator, partial [Armatimonadetes bacterium]|nr:response regulator [Armatimonadota bacterium]